MNEMRVGACVLLVVAFFALIVATADPPSELTKTQRNVIVQQLHTEIMIGQLIYELPQILPPIVEFSETLPRSNAAESICTHEVVSTGLISGASEWSLRVNERIAARNWDRFVSETLPHEAAHLLLCQLGVESWTEHDLRWETTVRSLGANPVAFHYYD